jgi:hypothetical protein
MASEYGSSPVEQAALHSRSRRVSRRPVDELGQDVALQGLELGPVAEEVRLPDGEVGHERLQGGASRPVPQVPVERLQVARPGRGQRPGDRPPRVRPPARGQLQPARLADQVPEPLQLAGAGPARSGGHRPAPVPGAGAALAAGASAAIRTTSTTQPGGGAFSRPSTAAGSRWSGVGRFQVAPSGCWSLVSCRYRPAAGPG